MALFRSPRGSFELPSELVNAIVEEVSAQASFSPPFHTKTLCALSSVCRTFYYAAQGRLLADIAFPLTADYEGIQKRAAHLALPLKGNPTWLHGVRSMALTFKEAYMYNVAPGFAESGPNSLTDLLYLVLQSQSLENFSILGYYHDSHRYPSRLTLHWDQFHFHGISTIIHGVHTNPSLESLKILNMRGLPMNLVLSEYASDSWDELTLINASFAFAPAESVRDSTQRQDMASKTLGRIQILAVLGGVPDFFGALHTYLGSFPGTIYPMAHFKQLHTLRISVPSTGAEAATISDVLTGVANTLKRLELRIRHSDSPGNYRLPISQLEKLKTLKICAEVPCNRQTRMRPQRVNSSIEATGYYIALAAPLHNLTSLYINLSIEIQDTNPPDSTPDVNLRLLRWAFLDYIAFGQVEGCFSALSFISLHIEKYRYDTTLKDAHYEDEDPEFGFEDILPRAFGLRSLRDVAFRVSSMHSSEHMTLQIDRSL